MSWKWFILMMVVGGIALYLLVTCHTHTGFDALTHVFEALQDNPGLFHVDFDDGTHFHCHA